MTNEEKFKRQTQLFDNAALKPCRHSMLCEKHKRCIDRMTKMCRYECRVCPPREVQHA